MLSLIIGKIFELQRNTESQLHHQIDMLELQLDDVETVKFDCEILQEEKKVLES